MNTIDMLRNIKSKRVSISLYSYSFMDDWECSVEYEPDNSKKDKIKLTSSECETIEEAVLQVYNKWTRLTKAMPEYNPNNLIEAPKVSEDVPF